MPIRWLLALVVAVEEVRQRATRWRQSDLAGPAAGLRGRGGGDSAGCTVGEGLSAAEVRQGGGGIDAGEAFAETGGTETGDRCGGVTVTGSETVRFGSHE